MLAESRKKMTTERTSIGRRLFVGRRAHRPPVGARKVTHRLILAPIVAGVAATFAVGCAVALARISSSRRAPARRTSDQRLGLLAEERLGPGLQRMAIGQIDLALESLGGTLVPDERAVHEARKAIKRLRAMLRILEGELAPGAAENEAAILRDVARGLAPVRDAAVMLATLDSALRGGPAKLSASASITRLRRALALERARVERETFGASRSREHAITALRDLRGRVIEWQLSGSPGIGAVREGLRHVYKQGRRRGRRLASGADRGVAARHDWRREIKDLRYAAQMLQRTGLAPAPGVDGPGPLSTPDKSRTQTERLAALAQQADELAEALGEEHDLALLADWIKRDASGAAVRSGSGVKPIGRRRRRQLLKLIARRRRVLRKRAMREGMRLYSRKPGAFAKRVARSYAAGVRVS
jgi:CHAD domain-containing protein